MFVTLRETLVGFAIGAAAGVAAGIVRMQFPFAADVSNPFLTILNVLPRVALAPMFIIWFGVGEGSKVALAVSLEDLGLKTGNARAKLLAKTLDAATGKLLDNNKNPSPKTGQLDNRGSQFYLAMYWAQELAAQTEDTELAAHFAPLARTLTDNEQKIVDELNGVQGQSVDIGGYYMTDPAKTEAVMRPSPTFNAALAEVRA